MRLLAFCLYFFVIPAKAGIQQGQGVGSGITVIVALGNFGYDNMTSPQGTWVI